jgi:hypothetical protein
LRHSHPGDLSLLSYRAFAVFLWCYALKSLLGNFILRQRVESLGAEAESQRGNNFLTALLVLVKGNFIVKIDVSGC